MTVVLLVCFFLWAVGYAIGWWRGYKSGRDDERIHRALRERWTPAIRRGDHL